MASKKTRNSGPKITVTKSEDYEDIFVSTVWGGTRPGHIEAVVVSESIEMDEALKDLAINTAKVNAHREIRCRLIFEPHSFKDIVTWMNEKLKEYEYVYGPIKTMKEVQEKYSDFAKSKSTNNLE
ncbi:MAG: hypothetical protein KC444_03630 [Nitrosopumilus sp.]|nr:hypothetical protein [Nitrosopumilus sp.]